MKHVHPTAGGGDNRSQDMECKTNDCALRYEDAVSACNSIAVAIGERMAKIIVSTVVLHKLEPDQMEDLVHHCINDVRCSLLTAGIGEHDAEAASRAVYNALVKEGARLSRSVTWEVGLA